MRTKNYNQMTTPTTKKTALYREGFKDGANSMYVDCKKVLNNAEKSLFAIDQCITENGVGCVPNKKDFKNVHDSLCEVMFFMYQYERGFYEERNG